MKGVVSGPVFLFTYSFTLRPFSSMISGHHSQSVQHLGLMSGTYLLHQQSSCQPPPDARALFGRAQWMRLRLRGAAMMMRLIDSTAARDLNEKIRMVKGQISLPEVFKDRLIAPALAPHITDIFQRSILQMQAPHIRDLDAQQFDQLLFIAALTAYGQSRYFFKSRTALMQTNVAFDDLPHADKLVTTYGVEQEFFDFDDTQSLSHAMRYFDPAWILTTDKTIDPGETFSEGLELISPILDRTNIHRLLFFTHLLAAERAQSSLYNRCALHVHAGIKNTFPDPAFQLRLIKQMVVNYAEIDEDISFLNSSMTTPYCIIDSAKKPFMESVLQGNENDLPVSESEISTTFQPFGRRFSRLNFLSLKTYGTAEFRHHPGTLKPQDTAHWVHFVNDFMRASVDMVSGQNAHIPAEGEVERLHDIAASFTRKTSLARRFGL